MKRSLQEVAELVVFGLIALLIGTGLLWLGGWALSLVGLLLKSLAGLLWLLLRYIVPVAIVAGLVYFLVKAAQGRQPEVVGNPGGTTTSPSGTAASPAGSVPPAATPVTDDRQPTSMVITPNTTAAEEVASAAASEAVEDAARDAQSAVDEAVGEAEDPGDAEDA